MNIEKLDYTATPADIRLLAVQYYAAQDLTGEGRTTYLRALVATSQLHVRLNASEPLAAVEQTHAQFYDEVLKAAQEATPPRIPNRAMTVNRKTNFARTSFSTLRAWLRADGDLMKLIPKRVTKAAVTAPAKVRAASPARLRRVVENRVATLLKALAALRTVDRDSAQTELGTILNTLAALKPGAPRKEPRRRTEDAPRIRSTPHMAKHDGAGHHSAAQ